MVNQNVLKKGFFRSDHNGCRVVLMILFSSIFGGGGAFAEVDQPIMGRYVRIERGLESDKELDFSEVEVFVDGKNVALNKPTSSSPEYEGYSSSLAVDGITGLNNYQNAFATLPGKKRWWEVDLGAEVDIERINIYTRSYNQVTKARLKGSSLMIKRADGSTVYSETLVADGNTVLISKVFYTRPVKFERTIAERMSEVAPHFDRLPPATDVAYVMPVGNGDLTAMLRYAEDYEIHLSKQDFFSVDHPTQTFHWASKSHSPGNIKLSFGLSRSEITGFDQSINYTRGSVILKLTTDSGTITAETYGVMDGSAIIVEVNDTRPKVSANVVYSNWRPLNDTVNPISITAMNHRIQATEVHKYDTRDRTPPKSPPRESLFYNLGVGTQIAFASQTKILPSSTRSSGNNATLTAKSPGSHYWLIISCATTFDGNPGAAATTLLNDNLAANKTVLLQEHLAWWTSFWEKSYVDLYGANTKRLMESWFTTMYTFAILGDNPVPPLFNGGGLLVDEDKISWGIAYYWQNCRELIWPTSVANHREYTKRYLEYYDYYFTDGQHTAARHKKLGIQLYEAPSAHNPNQSAPAKKATAFNKAELETAVANHGIEEIKGMGANTRSFAQAAELTQQMFDYVAFSGDTEFLDSIAKPWLKEAALFYLSSMKLEDGMWHIMKSDALETLKMVKNSTPDMSAIRYLFSMVVAYGSQFGYEADFISAVQERLANIAPYAIGHWEKGPDNVVTINTAENSYSPATAFSSGSDGKYHNIENPELYLVYPFAIVDAQSPQAEYDRAVRTLELRNFPNYAGWSQGSVWAARLHQPNTFDIILDHAQKQQKYPYGGWSNVSNYHKNTHITYLSVTPYLDSMGVNLTGLQEALLQSHRLTSTTNYTLTNGGPIQIIPAVNDQVAGRFRLLARGGFMVTTQFQMKRKVIHVTIKSERGEELKLNNPFASCQITKNGKPFRSHVTQRLIELPTTRGDTFTFTSDAP